MAAASQSPQTFSRQPRKKWPVPLPTPGLGIPAARISTPAPSCNDYTATTVAPVQLESFLQDGRGQHLFVTFACNDAVILTHPTCDSWSARPLYVYLSRRSKPDGPRSSAPKIRAPTLLLPLETMTEKDDHPVYPQYCFHLSPTINRFCPLRSGDIESLTTHPGFAGAPITTLAPSQSPTLIPSQDKTSSSTETFPCDGSVSPAW